MPIYSVRVTLDVFADSKTEAFDQIKDAFEQSELLMRVSDTLDAEMFAELGVDFS
jgi:hypothetical protein